VKLSGLFLTLGRGSLQLFICLLLQVVRCEFCDVDGMPRHAMALEAPVTIRNTAMAPISPVLMIRAMIASVAAVRMFVAMPRRMTYEAPLAT